MSTEVTPESMRTDAMRLLSKGFPESSKLLRMRADDLERAQARPLPAVPGWYSTIVVERGGESCTGALLRDDGNWATPRPILHSYAHLPLADYGLTIRWAEQDGKTPGQTLYEATDPQLGKWSANTSGFRGRFEQRAAAVLAAHGTPTLTEWKCPGCGETTRARMADQDAILTPVGEHPEPGTRGLLPVVALSTGAWQSTAEWIPSGRYQGRNQDILADPRPGGAQ